MLRELFEIIRSDKTWITPGLDEFFLFQQLVEQQEQPFSSFEEMATVLRVLWLKSPEHLERFNKLLYVRKAAIQEYLISPAPDRLPKIDSGEHLDSPKILDDIKTDNIEKKISTKKVEPQLETDASSLLYGADNSESHRYFFSLPGEASDLKLGMTENDPARENFLFSDGYFPVKNRFLQHGFRKLALSIKDGYINQIDVEATIESITHSGYLSEFKLVRRYMNQINLFIFSDRQESMVVVEDFVQELFFAAEQTNLKGHVIHKTFDKVPKVNANGTYMLRDEAKREFESLPKIFGALRKKEIVVLIYSDAGALKYKDELGALRQQINFISRLYKHVSYVAWINPAPMDRWEGTNAGAISECVPMFEANREGLEAAVQALKGKKVNKTTRNAAL